MQALAGEWQEWGKEHFESIARKATYSVVAVRARSVLMENHGALSSTYLLTSRARAMTSLNAALNLQAPIWVPIGSNARSICASSSASASSIKPGCGTTPS